MFFFSFILFRSTNEVAEAKSSEDIKKEESETSGARNQFRKFGKRVAVANRMRSLTSRGREWAGELKDKSKNLTGCYSNS